MDKYELVLDIVEHPEKYSAEQLREIMADAETKEIYTLLCKTDSAVEANKKFDAEAGWEAFAAEHIRQPHRRSWWFGSRAASIAAIIGGALVAVAAGVAITVSVSSSKPDTKVQMNEVAVAKTNVAIADTVTQVADSIIVPKEPIIFENVSLEDILKQVEAIYHVKAEFKNKEAAALHLYYTFDPALPLDKVVEQLNTFEQINITLKENALTIN